MISNIDINDYTKDGYKQPSTRSSVLNEAEFIVNGARANVYGGPENSFTDIGNLWGIYLGKTITPVDVALMMNLMKVARLMATPTHRDSWVDMAGYAACGAECAKV